VVVQDGRRGSCSDSGANADADTDSDSYAVSDGTRRRELAESAERDERHGNFTVSELEVGGRIVL
jgi:hypothetical protein